MKTVGDGEKEKIIEGPSMWVFVRDIENDLVYYGYIRAYSESREDRELILKEVEVYSNSTGEWKYAIPMMYLSREAHKLSIEIVPEKMVVFKEENDTLSKEGKDLPERKEG
jgi:hypothetical protein